ncbi:hypothetical protein JCM33374_g6206 [Metschnikowia sp. JCM 33374]|nr:hypothetical protein JCM33374_g6206 [Metschnikowia sp. JCM 33374]
MQRSLYNSISRAAMRSVSAGRLAARPAAITSAPRFAHNMSVRWNSSKTDEAKTTEQEAKGGAAEAEASQEAAEPQEDPVTAELREKLLQKDKALAEMKNHYARSVADFRNLQETTKKEIQKAKDFALQKFAKDLLESVDNFGLALNSVKQETLDAQPDMKNLFDGVSMTRNVFEKTLEKHGIQKIDPMGEQFDPNQHEATFEIPQPDKEPGTVFHVQQPGFTLNSRVLRPAKVGLVKGEE